MTTSPTTTAPFTLFASRSLDTIGADDQGHGLEVALLADDRILLTVPDAARRLGISRSMLYELLAAGEIESVHVGRLRRVPTDALTTFVGRLRHGPPEPAA